MGNFGTNQFVESGMQARANNNQEQALACFNQALQQGGESADLLYVIGDTLHDLGRLDQAIEHLKRARLIDAQHIGAVYTLAVALQDKGQLEESIECYRVAESLRPDHPRTYNNMGSAYQRLGRMDEAIACYEKAIKLAPDFFQAHYNLGTAQFLNKSYAIARISFQQVISLNPKFSPAHNNYANLLKEEGQLKAASEEYRLAILHNPNLHEAYYNLPNVLMKMWQVEEALDVLGELLALEPRHVLGYSNYLFYSHYSPRFNADDYYRMARSWEKNFSETVEERGKSRVFTNTVNQDRKLKIGYVSADFCMHPVVFFIEGVLASHDKSKVEVFCYYNHARKDIFTARMASLADHWRDIVDMPDEQVEALIRKDEIDLLVDLGGHTESNRMLVFASKPAPVQATWLGYCDTTGLTAMDYLIADEVVIPSGTGQQFSESVWRLPETHLNYVPREYSPAIDTAGESEHSRITFGCFNNLTKITGEAIELWASILHGVENSRMLIISQLFKDPEVAERVTAIFVHHGVEADRINLEYGVLEHSEFLKRYLHVDIALDTFPYNGVTTTCDALWMGIPVVAKMGDQFISRNSASILTALGLPELIAKSDQEYVEIAISLARDANKRKVLKAGLRNRFKESALGDAARFTLNLEQAYRGMWKKWCVAQKG